MPNAAFVVINPASGQAQLEALRTELEEQFSATGWTYTGHELAPDEPIGAVVRGAVVEQYDLIVAAGGDGTVRGVAGQLVNSSIPLGLIPTGTGNVLARDLGIPLNMPEAVSLLVEPHRLQSIDAMQLHDVATSHYCFLNTSIGVSSAVMRDTDSAQKQRLGFLAYILTGLRKLAGVQPVRFDLHIDDQPYHLKAADIVVANSGMVGLSALRLDSDIALNDGEVSVCAIRARSAIDYVQQAAAALLSRNHTHSIWCKPARSSVRIHANRPLPVQADGDPVAQQSIEITIIPQAVSVIVPLEP